MQLQWNGEGMRAGVVPGAAYLMSWLLVLELPSGTAPPAREAGFTQLLIYRWKISMLAAAQVFFWEIAVCLGVFGRGGESKLWGEIKKSEEHREPPEAISKKI